MEVNFDLEQSLMALQLARAEEYIDTVREIYAPARGDIYTQDETDKTLLEILKTYDETEDPEFKLFSAEVLADTVINMVVSKVLNLRGLTSMATLKYRKEVVLTDIHHREIEVVDVNRCEYCLTRPIVFPESKSCVTRKLTGSCDPLELSSNTPS